MNKCSECKQAIKERMITDGKTEIIVYCPIIGLDVFDLSMGEGCEHYKERGKHD